MRAKSFNPAQNKIPKSVKEQSLIEAIENSGYPLQGVVAGKLLKMGFHVIEEWAFPGRNSPESRTLDLTARLALELDDLTNVVPGLFLLIECKKSVHPYVFFRTLAHQDMSWFPRIAGLPHGGISLLDEKDGMVAVQRVVPGAKSLGLEKLPFVASDVGRAAVFSKAEANGDKVKSLSGDEPFNHVIMPLVSACDHALQVHSHGPFNDFVFPRLLISVAVLDAPMVLIESPEQCSDPVLSPWVRVIRQEPRVERSTGASFQQYAVDAVHVGFFDTFIETYLLPFAKEFGKRAIQLGAGPMLNGGRVPNCVSWEWTEITEYRR